MIPHTIDRGHTLDLVITRADDDQFDNIAVDNSLPSDQFGEFQCQLARPQPQKTTCTSRITCNVSRDNVASSIHRYPIFWSVDATIHHCGDG